MFSSQPTHTGTHVPVRLQGTNPFSLINAPIKSPYRGANNCIPIIYAKFFHAIVSSVSRMFTGTVYLFHEYEIDFSDFSGVFLYPRFRYTGSVPSVSRSKAIFFF